MTNKPKRRLASDEAHSWARNLHLGNPLAKLLLCMLAGYVNSDGECWVGVNSLAQDCDCDRKTIMRRLEWLEQRGHITRQRQWVTEDGDRNSRHDGRRTTDLIKLVIEDVEYSSIESMSDEELQQMSGPPQGPEKGSQNEVPGPSQGVPGPLAVRLRSVSGPTKEGPQYEPFLEPEKKDARARARPPSGARSRAKKETTKVPPADPFEFVCLNTHLWRALEKYRSSIGQAMPKFIHRGNGDHANHTGTFFRKSELSAASRCHHPPEPPPNVDEDWIH
jgi:hypothetical protein